MRSPKVRREAQELSLLFEISRILDRSMDLRDVVNPVLKAIADHMGMLRGKPAVVARISEEPLFLNRTQARKGLRKKDISFICVPIKLGNEVIGALSVDRLFNEKVSLNEDVRLLSIIASMIARAVRLRRSVREERERLLEKNARLQGIVPRCGDWISGRPFKIRPNRYQDPLHQPETNPQGSRATIPWKRDKKHTILWICQ